MSRGSRVRSHPELTHLLQCIGNSQGLVRYDFNRLAVYLSFRTPIGGSFPLPPGGATGLKLYTMADPGGLQGARVQTPAKRPRGMQG